MRPSFRIIDFSLKNLTDFPVVESIFCDCRNFDENYDQQADDARIFE
jgi:hypothetical protein